MGAISPDRAVEYQIGGQTIRMAVLDKVACSACHGGRTDKTFQFQEARRFTTFTSEGHCGMCLIHCPKGTHAPS